MCGWVKKVRRWWRKQHGCPNCYGELRSADEQDSNQCNGCWYENRLEQGWSPRMRYYGGPKS